MKCPWCNRDIGISDECMCGWERGDPTLKQIEKAVKELNDSLAPREDSNAG